MRLVVIICVFFCLSFKAQIIEPFDNKCENFTQQFESNGKFVVEFVTNDFYNELKKKKIEKNKFNDSENSELMNDFKKRYPKIFSDSCKKFNFLIDGKVVESQVCTDVNLIMIDKKFNFYIFKYSGFEISGYLLFNEDNQIAKTFSSYPFIYENGKVITEEDASFNENKLSLYKRKGNDYESFAYKLSPRYKVKDFELIKDNLGNYRLIAEIQYHPMKLIKKNENGSYYESDQNNGCNIKLQIY